MIWRFLIAAGFVCTILMASSSGPVDAWLIQGSKPPTTCVAATGDAWNTSYSQANVTITGQTAQWTSSGEGGALGIISKTAGKCVFGIQRSAGGDHNERFGVTASSNPNNALLGDNNPSIGFGVSGLQTGNTQYWKANAITTPTGYGCGGSCGGRQNAIYEIAIDFGAQLAWVRWPAIDPTWYGDNGTGDPATGTNGFSFSGITATTFFISIDGSFGGSAAQSTYVMIPCITGVNPSYVPTGYADWAC